MKQRHQKHAIIFSLLTIFLSIIVLSGCRNSGSSSSSGRDFDTFINSCFKEYVSSDIVTLHFNLSDPSAFGISEDVPVSYGDLSYEGLKENCEQAGKYLSELESFDPKTLSDDQQLTWELFKIYLEQNAESEKYILYQTPFGTNGLQSQIPVTLSEYRLDNEKDVKDYLALVNQIPELFEQILSLEEERRKADIISPDFIISNTIDQIDQFLSGSEENNLLIESFEERIKNVEGLSVDQKNTYIKNNRSLVRQVVFPAYTSLKESLEKYLGTGTEQERLCQYEHGTDYYELLLASNVGTDMSPEECISSLENQLQTAIADITALTKENPDLYTEYLSSEPKLSDPNEILEELKSDTYIDFPEPPEVSYTLKKVPDALSSTSACAFYLVPPIDSTAENIIYINQSRVNSREQFSTLAHEGYPGHLYQTNYYLSTNPSPLRRLLRCDGYDEGWGTYAQLYSYQYVEYKNTDRETTAQLQQLYYDNDVLSLSLSSLSDLYVNYKNYDLDALTDYLSTYGITEENAEKIYQYVIENPTTYLSYSIGWCELTDLRDEMEKQLGDSFDIKEFHQAVLDTGSCPFSVLREKMQSTN